MTRWGTECWETKEGQGKKRQDNGTGLEETRIELGICDLIFYGKQ